MVICVSVSLPYHKKNRKKLQVLLVLPYPRLLKRWRTYEAELCKIHFSVCLFQRYMIINEFLDKLRKSEVLWIYQINKLYVLEIAMSSLAEVTNKVDELEKRLNVIEVEIVLCNIIYRKWRNLKLLEIVNLLKKRMRKYYVFLVHFTQQLRAENAELKAKLEKNEYRIKHLIRSLEEEEKKEEVIAKMQYRINHLIRSLNEAEGRPYCFPFSIKDQQ